MRGRGKMQNTHLEQARTPWFRQVMGVCKSTGGGAKVESDRPITNLIWLNIVILTLPPPW